MLTIDYTNCMADRVGEHGADPAMLATDSAESRRLTEIARALAEDRGQGWERWRLLAFEPLRSELVDPVRAMANELRGQFENMIVLGIGGSALGLISAHAALCSPNWNLLPADARGGPRLFVLDNADPDLVTETFRYCDVDGGGLAKTLVVVVSKSGETAETASQFLIARDLLRAALGDDAHTANIVAVTDAHSGTLRSLCDATGYRTLPVPEGVGGRFSVLSPVGLFPLAMCGVDIDGMLDGAAAMDARCAGEAPLRNPAATLASLLVRLGAEKGKPNHVLMPYANALLALADWYRQLWAESLGKRVNNDGDEVFAGFTPIKALGATDQHSQVQLYREGPNDKVIGFVEVAEHGATAPIPSDVEIDALKYLSGSSLAGLLQAEKRATEYALTQSQRPNYTIQFPRIDAHHVGEFIQLWQMTTAYAGRLLDINAYDQPAVELGKLATFALMGRDGYDDMRAELDADAKAQRRTV